MNLQSTISLYCGGPGSGCTGDNCGRKPLVVANLPAGKGWHWIDNKSFFLQHSNENGFDEDKIGSRPASPKNVPFEKLIPSQSAIRSNKFNDLLQKNKGTNGDPADVVKIGDKYYVYDGHHRIAADIYRGDKNVSAYVRSYR